MACRTPPNPFLVSINNGHIYADYINSSLPGVSNSSTQPYQGFKKLTSEIEQNIKGSGIKYLRDERFLFI